MVDSPNVALLLGCMGKDRYFAAVIDQLLALIVALVPAAQLASHGPVVSWTVFGLGYYGYFFLSELLTRNTFGKWSMGLCIRTLSGERCTRWQLTIRSFWRVLELNFFILGGIPAAIAIVFSRRKQRIGDMMAGTLVVKRSEVA
jgi:uncharacterized RDD family membrane protein YckC